MHGVRVAAVLVSAVLCALALSACDLLTASVFPDYLTRLERTLDLSPYLADTEDGGGSTLRVLPASGNRDRLFLTTWRPGYEPRLLVLDDDLDILADWDQPSASSAAGGGSFGRLAMVDANYRYVAGSIVFDPATLAPVQATGAPSDAVAVAFSGFNNYVISVDNSSQPKLRVDVRDPAWVPVDSWEWILAPSGLSLYPASAIRANDGAQDIYWLVFGLYQNAVILALPASEFDGGPSTSQPLIDPSAPTPPYPWLPMANVRADSAQFTVDGVVLRNDRGERQLWGEGGLLETYESDDEGDVEEAYSPFGGSYYVLNRQSKQLLKLKVWW